LYFLPKKIKIKQTGTVDQENQEILGLRLKTLPLSHCMIEQSKDF
jgi:hypothetical protein